MDGLKELVTCIVVPEDLRISILIFGHPLARDLKLLNYSNGDNGLVLHYVNNLLICSPSLKKVSNYLIHTLIFPSNRGCLQACDLIIWKGMISRIRFNSRKKRSFGWCIPPPTPSNFRHEKMAKDFFLDKQISRGFGFLDMGFRFLNLDLWLSLRVTCLKNALDYT